MGKYKGEKGSKRDSDVNPKSEKDKLKTDFAKKGENQDRNQPSKPSEWKDERSKSQYNPRSTSQSQSGERDTREPKSGDDQQRPRSGK